MNSLITLAGNLQRFGEIGEISASPRVTLALVSLAAAILMVSGIKKKATLGIMLMAAMIFIAARLGLTSFAQVGFVPPDNWLSTICSGLLIGSSLSILSIIVIQPLIENITGQPHDVSMVEGIRRSWKALLIWLVFVWSIVAFGEELMFRGFLMSQLITLAGNSFLGLGVNVLLTSVVFGLSHSYQGRSGVWSTGFIGACLGVIFILNGHNLWLPIIVHGVIDTVEMLLMYRGADKWFRELIWKKSLQPEN